MKSIHGTFAAALLLLAGIFSGGCDLQGEFVGPSCMDLCQDGDTICSSAGELLHCTGPNPQGCYYWGPPEPCPPSQVCAAGDCECVDPCHSGDGICFHEVGMITCFGPDIVGCYDWGEMQPCLPGQICRVEQGECVEATPPAECTGTNDCDYEGQRKCPAGYPTKYRNCYVDEFGCLKWDCT